MWIKKGLVYRVTKLSDIMYSHVSIPFGMPLTNRILRIFFSSRDNYGKSRPFYIDVNSKKPTEIIKICKSPLLELGELGTFDDCGIMPSWFIKNGDFVYMYYIGWNPQVNVSYRLSIGLAISDDGGESFKKYSKGPICDRDLKEPYFNTAPCVIKEDNIWRMWYISCTEWQLIDNYPEPKYHVKYAESKDGIHWEKEGIVCIDYDNQAEAIGRPSVYLDKKENKYKMYYSYRLINGYRKIKEKGYQIGYAESLDGKNWDKLPSPTGLSLSKKGWDSQMMEYCHVFELEGEITMLYNGNNFGETGFGYAVNKLQ
ncbi:MAG: hypothetical protein JXR07_20175 [Reichenbachiella sp.]